jgi:hypothetical protein
MKTHKCYSFVRWDIGGTSTIEALYSSLEHTLVCEDNPYLTENNKRLKIIKRLWRKCYHGGEWGIQITSTRDALRFRVDGEIRPGWL